MIELLGITKSKNAPQSLHRSETQTPKFQVHSVRMASRIGNRGQLEREYVVEIIQSRDGYFDAEIQKLVDTGKITQAKKLWKELYRKKPFKRDFRYRCGCTLLIDTKSYEIRRVIRTRYRVDEDAGLNQLRRHLTANGRQARNAFDDPSNSDASKNAFADLHRHVEAEKF